MTSQTITFYIVHMVVLFLAELIWSAFLLFVLFRALKEDKYIFTGKFFLFVLAAAFTSLAVSWGFDFAITNVSTIEGIWLGLGRVEKIGLLLVPTFILMYVYFYLASLIFKFKTNHLLIIVLVLGIANSPWRILLG